LLQIKDTLNDHRHVRLPDIFKENECIEARIGDFDIDSVLDEETPVNIMPERTWEAIGRPAMIPSLRGIGLFQKETGKPMWEAHLDTYECQWKFDRRRF
jgi:hypothetical protein